MRSGWTASPPVSTRSTTSRCTRADEQIMGEVSSLVNIILYVGRLVE